MTITVKNSQEFKINELIIVTKNGNIDISTIYEEINIYDSLFVPVVSGKIMVNDSIGLSSKLLYDGSESILMDISKSADSPDAFNFKRAFRIYRQSSRSDNTTSSETYVLSFVSDELIFSDQQRINQAYEMNYTSMVKNILANYLKAPENQLGGIYDDTVGIRKVVIPNLRPFEAIEWCAKRAVDEKQAPNFMFYQNLTGYNFASLSKLLVKPIILNIKYEPKNTADVDAVDEISSARSLEIVSQTDAIQKTRSGVNSGKFVGFDPMTRTIAEKEMSYDDHYKLMDHANPNPNVTVIPNRDKNDNVKMFNAKKTVNTFSAARQYSNYIKKYDPTSITKEDNVEQYMFQRKAIINNLMERRVKLTMPGNFQLSSGFNVYLNVPVIAKKEKGENSDDPTLTGKYIIVGARHIIGFEKFQTIIEVATTSTENEFIAAGSPQQTQEILEY